VAGETHPPHARSWAWARSGSFVSSSEQTGDLSMLTAALETKVRPGRVSKKTVLVRDKMLSIRGIRSPAFAGRLPLDIMPAWRWPRQGGSVRIAVSPPPHCVSRGLTPIVQRIPSSRVINRCTDTKWDRPDQVPVAAGVASGGPHAQPRASFRPSDLVQLGTNHKTRLWSRLDDSLLLLDDGYLLVFVKDQKRSLNSTTVIGLENHGPMATPWNATQQCALPSRALEDVTA